MAKFPAYFDSGVLIKLYHLETGSREVSEQVREVGSIPLPFLGEIEMRNALRVLLGRKMLSGRQFKGALSLLDADLRLPRLIRSTPDPGKVAATAEELSQNFGAATLCRALDLLHVSYAVVLKTPRFHTGDKRQAALAKKAGLEVVFLDQ